MARDWEGRYADGNTPWDHGRPDRELLKLLESGRLPRGRALDVGCGTGTNVRYLAAQGYDALGIDIAQAAIDRAQETPAADGSGAVSFQRLDFLEEPLPEGSFDLIFDRGCFHVFDHAEERERFAARVAGALSPEGLWISLIGCTEGAPRDTGPPRRSARDVIDAVEPALEIATLEGIDFDASMPDTVRGWLLIARRRALPAQPSSKHEG